MAAIGFVVLFSLYAFLRSRKSEWSRKVYAPRLFTTLIPPRVQPRSPWGWVNTLIGRKVSQRILEEVGMDAFMVNRVLVFCATVFACLAPFALFILIPLYGSMAQGNERMENAGLEKYTIKSMLNSSDKGDSLWIVIGMTYWNSAVVLYLLHSEYRRYITKRHGFLRRAGPQSYTVLVERIPKQLCNRPALMHYFRKIFGNRVLAADVVDNNPLLNYAVKKRLQAVTKLERAQYEFEMSGRRPWRLFFPWMCGQIKQRVVPLGVTDDVEPALPVNSIMGTSAADASAADIASLLVASGENNGSDDENNISDDEDDDNDDISDSQDNDEDQAAHHRDDTEQIQPPPLSSMNANLVSHNSYSPPQDDRVTTSVQARGPFYSSPASSPRNTTQGNFDSASLLSSHGHPPYLFNDAEPSTTATSTTAQAPARPEGVLQSEAATPMASSSNNNSTSLLSEQDNTAAEEQEFLQQWHREQGLANGNGIPRPFAISDLSGTGARKRPQRRNRCLWFLAWLNFSAYIDAIKSYETEVRVWNRRIKRLKERADKKRKKQEDIAKANVVEPSRQVIQEQIKVRLRGERRATGRKSTGATMTSAGSTVMSSDRSGQLRRRSGSYLQGKSGSFAGMQSPLKAGPISSGSSTSSHSAQHAMTKHQAALQQQQKTLNHVAREESSSIASSFNAIAGVGDKQQLDNDRRLSRSSNHAPNPWDDGSQGQFNTLASDHSKSLGGFVGSELDDAGTCHGGDSSIGDDSSYFMGEDEYMQMIENEDEHALFEHAGFDDLLRYAVDQNERSSAFVTFSTLTATMCAAESVVDRPLKMSISIAPELRDVLWENLGLSLPVLAFFTWVIRALLVAIVLVFGVVSASLAALTNLDAITNVWPWLKDWLLSHKEWGVVVQQISPMAMVILYNLVPPLINFLLKIQRRRSLSEAQVEFFRIYFHFLVIQVFLFYTIAGGLLQNMRELINRPLTFLSLLGKALPANELFFLQYLITRSFLLSLELLRLSDICIAFLRGIFKSSRTARERRTPCCGWHTIDHPSGGQIERTVSTLALCFSIALSYSVICPAMSVAALVYFSLASIVYRNQLLYVYTHERESAGLLFPFVFRALITGVIIFQLIMMGIFTVHGSASSFTLLVPLLFATLTFLLFCENAYENTSRYVPLGDAAELDIINGPLKKVLVEYKHPSTRAPQKIEVQDPQKIEPHSTRGRGTISSRARASSALTSQPDF